MGAYRNIIASKTVNLSQTNLFYHIFTEVTRGNGYIFIRLHREAAGENEYLSLRQRIRRARS